MKPYYDEGGITLYLGDCRDILPTLGPVDLVVADPPYQETSLGWDAWVRNWPATIASHANSLWCFGSLRMFLEHVEEFKAWRFAQDVVWEKQAGSNFAADRFKRVHEHVVHWYCGSWDAIYRNPLREQVWGTDKSTRRKADKTRHTGRIGDWSYTDDGMRMVRSVLRVRNLHRRGEHPTQKPVGIIDPILAYSLRPGGVVLDPFAGSGSTLVAAKLRGARAIGIEIEERYCEVAVKRLAQEVLPLESAMD